ncbi:MAG: M23 family metallopeptidase, partial [Treponema sp.]|nr:M23 family metallopeptidase [Treponema sp.]
SRRVFVNADGRRSTSIHAGVDIRSATGTEVFSSGAGRVALARERIVSGNTVIVEHLPGIFSLYYHLDSLAVKEGQTVARGALVGRSGSTGLSTGPHLHWEIRVFGENTDPDAFLARPLIDREAILGMLEEESRDDEGGALRGGTPLGG